MNPAELAELHRLLPNCLRQDRLRLEAEANRWLDRVRQGRGEEPDLRRWLAAARKSVELRHRRHERAPQVDYPAALPITARKDEIVAAIKQNQVVVIAGETGSGKTTQIPKMCLEAGLGIEGKIACTQPRRVAALSISRRIAEELRVNWGDQVGCKIRFSDRTSPATYVKLMTDGILLAETQGDPDLTEYEAIVIDEAHERSLNIDFLLGHLKLLLPRRPDLKLVITSATIDTESFSKAFGNAPVLEVSGRTYPVEIRYAPHDPSAEESGDLTYIDAAVAAVEDVLLESERGDVLIFMPSERDIRETQDDLHGRFRSEAEIIPLFGRLSSGEQDRVFSASPKRKIIVSTNIAETSLTIPGVRYVIDTGLARMSRYSPRARTKRLPIEPVSQSSANQRAGRSGRVENGVCIRLYSQEDFEARPKYTQPEIQRANLAEVILKMKAWRLGEMETFPFLNPPQPQAVTSGYQLLQELGALDENRTLTELGRELARLPVDPSIGRMILESQVEGRLEEVLIIAAGLSVQDPRERPVDQQEAADLAHKRFLDPNSDFLSLLNIWNAYDAKFEALQTQNQMRKFCRANFLSYTRMREWADIHAQLAEAVGDLSGRKAGPARAHARPAAGEGPPPHSAGRPRDPMSEPAYATIHRSILTGLLGHVSQRIERNLYRAPGSRQVMIWPGSSLFDRTPPKGKSEGNRPLEDKRSQPEWLVAGELVETSRLFGRTVAGVKPEWIAELGAHVCKRSYGEPHWDKRAGRVLAHERITLFGLGVLERRVDYGRINPGLATEVFIRSALVEEEIDTPHPFLGQNRQLRQKIDVWRSRSRDHRFPNTDDALFQFYSQRLPHVSSVHDLNRVIKERSSQEPGFLIARDTDLTGGIPIAWDSTSFPTEVTLENERATVEYAYAPGEEHDGVTVKLPVALAHRIDPDMLDWIVPGLRTEQIESLLKGLPKSLRVPLMPIAPKVAELAGILRPAEGLDGLRRLVQERYGVQIPPELWKRESLPEHLRPRVAITGKQEKIVAAGRDLDALKLGLEKHETSAEQQAWTTAVQKWERYDVRTWSFGTLPEQIPVTAAAGAALYAFPGLELDGGTVHLKLFKSRQEAEKASRAGFVRLAELALQKELAWVQKDLRSLEKIKDLFAEFISFEELTTSAYDNLKRHIIRPPELLLPLSEIQFNQSVEKARSEIPGLISTLTSQLATILKLRQQIVRHRAFAAAEPAPKKMVVNDLKLIGATPAPLSPNRLAYLKGELDSILPKNFLQTVPFDRLAQLPRYLKALFIRVDRAMLNPARDVEKAKLVKPFVEAMEKQQNRTDLAPAAQVALDEFRWLVEEYKISVFAQELGTAQPVSPKRLEAQLKLVG